MLGETCKDCVHFYVTHDPGFPRGCSRMGFKGQPFPYMAVREVSGKRCEMRFVRVRATQLATAAVVQMA